MIRSKVFSYVRQKCIIESVLSRQTTPVKYSNCCKHLSSTKAAASISNIQQNVDLEEGKVKSAEREFLVRLKADPDVFGTPPEPEIVDEGDIREEKYFTEQPLPSQQLRTKRYADIIKDLIRQRKIKEAIDVVEIRMLKEDRVKPENYIYNLLLGACGRVGYTKKAFMLYNNMKKRGLVVTAGTYTALFNACANSPWPLTDGIARAKKLYEIMNRKGHEPNDTNYNAMIKAFGRCGDLPMAFHLADEMLKKGFVKDDSSITFLLQACITDKEAGFRHALLVWRKLVEKNIKPSVYTYNLLLKTMRDCGLGDLEVTEDIINKLVPPEQRMLPEPDNKLLTAGVAAETKQSNIITNTVVVDDSDNKISEVTLVDSKPLLPVVPDDRPNLMAPIPHLGNIISLTEITKPEERLLLVGGCSGFLDNMELFGCKPDIKTYTQLIELIPSSLAAEKQLLNYMKRARVKPDVAFYNMLIRKRSMRSDYESAKEVLEMLESRNLRPNLITYGVLAIACKTRQECLELVDTMKQSKYRLNAEILGAMLHQACYHNSFLYVLEVMELCVREEVQPNKKFIETLESFRKHCKELSFNSKMHPRHEQRFIIFKKRYKTWLNEVQIDDSGDVHPWQQYRQKTEGVRPYKIKDTARFKARHTSLFKVKTSTKIRY